MLRTYWIAILITGIIMWLAGGLVLFNYWVSVTGAILSLVAIGIRVTVEPNDQRY